MSIGPATKDEKFSMNFIDKAKYTAKQTISAYFGDPLHYIFYIALTALVIGLFIGKEFSWEFYAVLIVLAVVKLVRFYKPLTIKTNVAAK